MPGGTPPARLSVGDMDVYSGDALKDGRKVGRGGGSCQTIHVDERVRAEIIR